MASQLSLNERLQQMESELTCPVCLYVVDDPYSLPCNHVFCRECLQHAFKVSSSCPVCKQPCIRRSMTKNHQMNNICEMFRGLQEMVKDKDRAKLPRESMSQMELISEQLKTPARPVAKSRTKATTETPKKEETSRRTRRRGKSDDEELVALVDPPKAKRRQTRKKKEPEPVEIVPTSPNVVPRPVTPQSSTYTPKARLSASLVRPSRLVLIRTGVTDSKDLKKVSEFSKKFGVCIHTSYPDHVTHLITPADEQGRARRTIKYLMSIAAGAWVLRLEWIDECLEAGKFIDEQAFEIIGDQAFIGGPQKAREAHGTAPILSNYTIWFEGSFGAVSAHRNERAPEKDHLVTLVEMAGATVVKGAPPKDVSQLVCVLDGTENDAAYIFEAHGIIPVTYHWILDSISSYTPRLISGYQWISVGE